MRAGSSASKAPSFATALAAPAPSPAPSQARKCPCCGHRTLRPTREPGRSCRYRNAYLTLPTELPVPTCRRCRHMMLTYESVPELKATLEATFRAELVHRASVEITHLAQFYSQRRIEREIDLAQGYLSRLKGGDGVPSVALVSLLALLRQEPSRIEELRGYWALPLDPLPSKGARKRAP